METLQLKAEIHTHVDRLSSERLKVALEFLAFLASRETAEEEEATQELLAIPNFEKNLAEAEADNEKPTDWRIIRSDVFDEA